MTRPLVLSFVLVSLAAAPPAPEPAEWRRLVEDLADEGRREAAAAKLQGIGEPALPLLRRAAKSHADIDVRLGATVVAAAIEKDVFGQRRRFAIHDDGVIALAVSPDGKRLVSSAGIRGTDYTPRIWDMAGSRELRLEGHSRAVHCMAWSVDGKRIVTGGTDGKLILWDAATGERQAAFTFEREILHLALTPDGKSAVICGGDPAVRVVSLASGRATASNEDHTQDVRGVAVTPDGKNAVSASRDGVVRLFDLATGKQARQMKCKHGALFAAVSPDGKLVASTGEEGEVNLFDADKGELVRRLEGHGQLDVRWAAFSPDGKRLITAGDDKIAIVWDVARGASTDRLEGHEGVVSCAAFLPDGERVVTSSHDKTVRLWRVRK